MNSTQPGYGRALRGLFVLIGLNFVISLMHAQSGIPLTGLIGYWPGNGTAADLSSVGNNGSYSGSYVPGAPTGGQAFNLATGKVVIPDIPAYDFQSYTGWSVGLWFNGNETAIDGSNGLFLGQDNGSGYQPKWFVNYGYTVFGPNNQFIFHVNDFNQERIFVGSQTMPAPTGWNQLTVTIGSTNIVDFYLNGQSIGSGSLGNYVLNPSAPLIFGYAEGFTFDGLMSDVVLYNRALSPGEVLQLASIPEPSAYAAIMGALAWGFAMIRKQHKSA